ncbi:hypothetical protein CSUI_009655 [Cystoisospora suis]|uniref:Uncharacterized protein n=1 Tax=Cystoisospora suis TaxID=483139 RepID=A0A2C6JG39_9APIC|nr:hypothetical protein CSUI_009655 [Cystoisospora suis]
MTVKRGGSEELVPFFPYFLFLIFLVMSSRQTKVR